ncbi:hypothetical protein GCM10009676_04230 [Prauserella halophila]|uniref:Uncharacterized protein n=1 Tax=Prauserella halophila TaxID=185641 RepID=A0ABP4GIZ4_9PSEU|nr:hypothetical protein [Prauserella halophila]
MKPRLLHTGRDWDSVQWFDVAGGNWSGYLQDPLFASAFLQALTTKSGVSIEGQTSDCAGRNAVAISVEASKPGDWCPEQRLLLLLNPERGVSISTDTVALSVDTSAMKVNIATPATISYVQWKQHARVPDTETRP